MNLFSFEWDSEKARRNFKKHGVSFDEAASIFNDPFSVTFDDSLHSQDEPREITIGFSRKHRLLIVVSTLRNESIRIISARTATTKERKDYENNASH